MRVILVGPGINYRYATFFYSLDKKLRNGLIRSGHGVTIMSDRDVADTAMGLRFLGRRFANAKLLEIVDAFRPDLIVMSQAHLISREALAEAKRLQPGLAIANVDCDLLTPKSRDRLVDLKGVVDATFLTSAGAPLAELRAAGLNASFLPNPTDASLEDGNTYDLDEHAFDLVYVSKASQRSQRWQFTRELAERSKSIDVGIFGTGTRIFGQEYFRLLAQARAALNWSERNDVPLYASDRIAQLFGAGNCVCLYAGSGFQQFFGPQDALFFRDSEQLAGKLRSVRGGQWREIARRGQQRYRSLFNETRVAQYVIDFTFGGDLSGYEWGKQ